MAFFKSVFSATILGLTLVASAHAQDVPDHIQAAVDNILRTEANVERDGDRKAGITVANYGVEPGDTVLDLFAGGGYFTEVFAGAVGEDGVVYAHQGDRNNTEERIAAYNEQYAPFGNINLIFMEDGRLPLEDNSVDVAFMGLLIHHQHYDEATPDERPARAQALFDEVYRVLKPGGTFGVTEHTAVAGASRAQSAAWHRITVDVAVADVTESGFEYVGNADTIHVNPDDDNANFWGETGLRGQTNRMVLTFTKPE